MSIWCDCLRLKDILSITIKIRSRIQTANNQNNIISMPAIHELNCIHANACNSIWICNLKPRHTRAHTYKHFNVIGEFLYSPSHSFGYVLCAKLHFNISFIIASIPSVIIFHNYELKGFIIYLFSRRSLVQLFIWGIFVRVCEEWFAKERERDNT